MKRKLTLAAVFLAAAAAMAVTLEDSGNAFVVKNGNYTAKFNKTQGASLELRINGAKSRVQTITATPVITVSGERDTYQNSYAADDSMTSLSAQPRTVEKVSAGSDKVVLKFSYALRFGKAEYTVSMDDTPVIRYDLSFAGNGVRISNISYNVSMTLSDPDGIFYPDAKRVAGFWMKNGDMVEGPSWEYAWFEKSKLGVGVVALPNRDLAGIEYSMQNRKEGWPSNYAGMKIVYSPLQKYGKQSKFDLSWQLIAGGNPVKAQEIADVSLKLEKKVGFHSYEAEKLTIRPGQDNKILAEIRNRTAADAAVKAKVFAVYGLDKEVQVASADATVKAGTIRKMEIPVKFPADAKLGVALRTELYDSAGKLLDSKTDFCSITDFVPRDSGFGIINVGMCYQDGSQDAWNRAVKKNYVGAYEYYCWAPSTIFGLAPKKDSWMPGTEAPYDSVLTKKFLKGLIDNAHSHGVGVYSWITGLWSYDVAIQHPEMLQYCENGQPNVYNGGIRKNGARRATLKPNVYTVERAAAWGDEMADSIEMFGWDGCRWDFSFLPSTANDPLYMGDKVADWYDDKGVPSSKLYPDPDTIGTECLKAWRKAVAKRYPNFIYGTNGGYSAANWKKFPKYLKEASTNGMLLFEDMLNFSRKEWCSFEKWGRELAIRTDSVRPQGGTPVVGAMRGLPFNSVAYHLAQYTCASAGAKWWSYGGLALKERSQERNRFFLRFAEYYFGTEFLLQKNCPVSLAEKQNVLFEPFVRQRKTAEGREIVIPVVNMPDNNDYICAYHDEPPVRKNTAFKVDLKNGETAEAWLMSPQSPEKAVKLPVSNGIVRVPELKDACMVLVRCKGGK